MTPYLATIGLTVLLVGAVLCLLPELSSRTTPLGVAVPTTRARDAAVRAAVARWRLGAAGTTALALVAVALLGAAGVLERRPALPVAVLLGQLGLAGLAWWAARRPLLAAKRDGAWAAEMEPSPALEGPTAQGRSAAAGGFAPVVPAQGPTAQRGRAPSVASPAGESATDYATEDAGSAGRPARRPPLTSYAIATELLIASCAVVLSRYEQLPDPYPTHWGADGRADAWSARTPLAVVSPALAGAAVVLLLLATALAVLRASKPGQEMQARVTARVLGPLTVAIGSVFAAITLEPLDDSPALSRWILIVSVAAVLLVTAWAVLVSVRARRGADLSAARNHERAVDDDALWLLGVLYLNPGDPALLAPKRAGVGFTLNVGHPVGLVVAMLTGALLLATALVSVLVTA